MASFMLDSTMCFLLALHFVCGQHKNTFHELDTFPSCAWDVVSYSVCAFSCLHV